MIQARSKETGAAGTEAGRVQGVNQQALSMKMETLLFDRVDLVPMKRRRPRAGPWGTPEEGVLSWMQ